MRVLVTGGAGFIGSAVVRRLVADGAQVLTVDKLTYAGSMDALASVLGHPAHRFERVDVCDDGALRPLLDDFAPEAVLHLAAETHVDRSIDDPQVFVRTNVTGTATLLEAARRYLRGAPSGRAAAFRFLHVSTDEVYGSLGDAGAFTESSPHAPNSPYAASKAGADHLARAWHHTYGIPVLTTNCANNYGPFQYPEKLIPLTILNALDERPLPVYGRGMNVRSWLHVDEHVDGLLAVLHRGVPGETYLIGAPDGERTNLEVVTLVCDLVDEATGRDPGTTRERIEFVTDRPGHDWRYAIDASRIRRELGWRPSRSFAEGLRETVRWYRANRDWCDRVERGGFGRARVGLAT